MKRVDRRTFLAAAGGTLAASAAGAQTAAPARIGLLATGNVTYMTTALFKGLSASGFVEGRNLTVVARNASGEIDKLPAMARELVEQKVDVIVAQGGPLPTRAAKGASDTIPIVFAYGGDPVADGLVASFNRPGGNVTGATFMGVAYTSKRLEILKQLVPKARTVALMLNPKSTLAEVQVRDARAAVPSLGLELQVISATDKAQIDEAFAGLTARKAQALLVGVDPSYGLVFRDHIVAEAARAGIPAMYDGRDYPDAGGLISYGSSQSDTWRQAGLYVGRILKGDKPADLPVMQPIKFEMVINLRAARAMGLEIPPNLLATADDTIE